MWLLLFREFFRSEAIKLGKLMTLVENAYSYNYQYEVYVYCHNLIFFKKKSEY